MKKASDIPLEIVLHERLRGSKLMVYFRWGFISLLLVLLSLQFFSGYKAESTHGFFLIAVYAVFNVVVTVSLRRNFDPAWLRYGAAAIDVSIISFHLFYLSGTHDPIAVSAAATTFLYPIMILLYTFRLDQRLLIFTTLYSIFSFSFVFFFRYIELSGPVIDSLSLTPASHLFKVAYILFIGFLCVYLQHSLKRLIVKQMNESKRNLEAEIELSLEQQKNVHAEELIRQEKQLNHQLEKEIQDRKAAEKALAESREILKSILSNLNGAVYRCAVDEHWTKFFISRQIEQISGYPPEDIINNAKVCFNELIHPDDREPSRIIVEESIQSKKPFEVEYRLIKADGSVAWVIDNGRAVFDETGKASYIDGVITDITNKKATEAAYHESEIRFRELTDFLPQTVYELDGKGNIVFTNRAGVELFGEKVRAPKGEVSALDFFIPEDRERMIINMRERLSGNHAKLFNEYTAICKEGRKCPVIIYSSPIARDGKVVGTRGIIVEISDLKKVEADLRKAKQELEELNLSLEKTVSERTRQLTEANTQLLRLQKENLQSQFDVLKQQVNPHFLFNSLNVLISLIKLEPNLAETFTERLAKVYRYVLENRDENLVPVKTEMDFLRAYIFLLDTRFQGKVKIQIEFDEDREKRLILPLSLQLLIENAIKHNTFSTKSPLTIRMFIDDEGFLNVINNLQIREMHFASTGIGLKNIASRYSLLSDSSPEFIQTETEYKARIPLLES